MVLESRCEIKKLAKTITRELSENGFINVRKIFSFFFKKKIIFTGKSEKRCKKHN